MSKKGFFIVGTDTGVGKTFFASILMKKYDFDYWKPIQTGKFTENDTLYIKQNIGIEKNRFHESIYSFKKPLSPHLASSYEKISINIKRKDVARCYRLIFRELDLKIPVVDPVKGVARIASIAGLGEKTKRKAIELLNKAKKIGIVAGKDPMGIAAAALYLSCISSGGNKTQKEISIASGVTEVTIRNRCAGLKKLLE